MGADEPIDHAGELHALQPAAVPIVQRQRVHVIPRAAEHREPARAVGVAGARAAAAVAAVGSVLAEEVDAVACDVRRK